MTKLKCQTCSNSISGQHCTMAKDMDEKSRIYKKCEGYKVYIAKIKQLNKKIVRKEETTDYESLGRFGKFLKRGGGYSFRTKKYIGVADNN